MLSALSGTVGMARQPFMSRLIEVYAVDAIADYVCGYLGVFSNEDTDLAETLKRFYPDNIDDKWKDDLELFFQLVEKKLRIGWFVPMLTTLTKVKIKLFILNNILSLNFRL